MKKAQSINEKISKAFALVCFSFIVLGIGGIQYTYSSILEKQQLERFYYENQLVQTQVNETLNSIESNCNSLIISINQLAELSENETLFVERMSNMRSAFVLNVTEPEAVSEISVLFNDGSIHRKNEKGMYEYLYDYSYFYDYVNSLGANATGKYFAVTQEHDVLNSGIYYTKKLSYIENLSTVGHILYKLDMNTINKNFENQYSTQYVSYYFFNEEEKLFSTDDKSFNPLKETETNLVNLLENIQKNDKLATQTIKLSQGWTFVSVYDINSYLRENIDNLYYLMLIVCSVFLLLYFIITKVVKHFIKPIAILSSHMNCAKNRFPSTIHIDNDCYEIVHLTTSFNNMIKSCDNLLEQVEKEQNAKIKFEMQLLQTQIKPHFLYNTLDTIICLNVSKRYELATSITKSLADYYRLILSGGENWITLKDEFDAVTRYLEIQTVRYSKVLSYEISLPLELQDCMIPKLTLQPLIENAIDHGIKPLRKKETVFISATKKGNNVQIQVRDFGKGIDEQTFMQYVSGEKPSTSSGGFGLKNVSDRVKMYYQGKGQLKFEPVEIGTKLIVDVPLVTQLEIKQ